MTQNTSKPKIMVQNISCILPEQSNLGGLFLGNVYGAQNPTILKEYGIRAVLTSSIETDIKYSPLDIPFHIKIEAHDNQNYNLKEKINSCIHFIEQARKFTNVYVHCFAGVSRSAAIVCAYIMWKFKWNYQTTISFVKAKRVVAKPNQGFIKQLNQIQQILINPSQQKKVQTAGFNQNYKQNYYQSKIKPQENQILAKIPISISGISPSMSPILLSNIQLKDQKQQENRYLVRQQINVQGNNQPYMREAPYMKEVSSYENYGQSNLENIHQQLKYLDINKNAQKKQQSSKQNPLRTKASNGENKMKNTIYQPQKPNNYAYLQNVFPSNQGQKQGLKRVQYPAGKPIKKEVNQQSSMKINNVVSNSMNYPSRDSNFYKVQMPQNPSTQVNTNNTSRQSNSDQGIVLGGKKHIHNHISIPIPRLSEKKESTQASHNLNRTQSQFYKVNNTIYRTHDGLNQTYNSMSKTHQSKEFLFMNSNDFISPPKYKMNDKYSITGMQSPRGNNIYNTNLDFRSSAPTEGFYNSKSKLQNKEVQKTMSRCLVKPKDLPGYKHYS